MTFLKPRFFGFVSIFHSKTLTLWNFRIQHSSALWLRDFKIVFPNYTDVLNLCGKIMVKVWYKSRWKMTGNGENLHYRQIRVITRDPHQNTCDVIFSNWWKFHSSYDNQRCTLEITVAHIKELTVTSDHPWIQASYFGLFYLTSDTTYQVEKLLKQGLFKWSELKRNYKITSLWLKKL